MPSINMFFRVVSSQSKDGDGIDGKVYESDKCLSLTETLDQDTS